VREKIFARTHKPQNLNSSYSNECLNKKGQWKRNPQNRFEDGLCATIDWLLGMKL
jgi:hypothetical protein